MAMLMSMTPPLPTPAMSNRSTSSNTQQADTFQQVIARSILNMAKEIANKMPDFDRLTLSIDGQTDGSKIPQTRDQAWVPQGLDYLPLNRWYILSSYYDRGRGSEGNASKLSAVDKDSEKHIKTVDLYQGIHEKHFGHVGGVTASHTHIYVASTQGKDNLILRYPIEHFVKAKHNDKLIPDQVYRLKHRTSYLKYEPMSNHLLIGKWVPKSKALHGELYRYPLDGLGNLVIDEVEKYQTPPDVQGIEVIGTLVLYSQSTGRRERSSLILSRLGKTKPERKWTLPSMSQGLVWTGGGIAINYESAAEKYREGGIGRQEKITIHPTMIWEK